MKIVLKNGKEAKLHDIDAIARLMGKALPQSYIDFVVKQDGARPEGNVLAGDMSAGCSVTEFIPIAEIWKEKQLVDGLDTALIPIAWAEGGNYVVLDTDNAFKVLFWDHEISAPSVKLSDDFSEFLDALEPFSADEVEMKSEQVLDAWIDPDFLKEIS